MNYLDNASTTRPNSASVKAVCSAMEKTFGNPSSLHGIGLDAENLMNDSRKTIAKMLGCMTGEVIFTSGATESNNLAILGVAQAYHRRGKRVITTTVEHASVSHTFDYLEKQGYDVVRIAPKYGKIDPEEMAEAVTKDTILLSCMMVNNETGMRLPVEQIARRAKQKNPNVLIHTDAVQAFCKIPMKLNQFPVDLCSVSGHKVYAPKGIGALFVKKSVRMISRSFGGSHEYGFRAGTESVPLIAGFAEAVRVTSKSTVEHLQQYTQLNQQLREQLQKFPEIVIHSPKSGVPYILNFSVPGIRSEIMLHFLEQKGIYVSSGSACSKGEKSPVLEAMGVPDKLSDSAVRVSFCPDNTEEQINELIQALEQGMQDLIRS